MTKCLTLFGTFPSHIVRKTCSASAQGIAYSNSVRTIPILRLSGDRSLVCNGNTGFLPLFYLSFRLEFFSGDNVVFPSIMRDENCAQFLALLAPFFLEAKVFAASNALNAVPVVPT